MKDQNCPCPVEPEDELVGECFGCPCCGERRMSQLEFVPPYREELECLTCGQVYEP
jgi:hypothetical protein